MEKDKFFFELVNYAWKYFEIHANQRITLFKFYTGFCTIFLSAVGYYFIRLHPDSSTTEALLLLILSIFLMYITWVFRGLDKRNRELIHFAENSLRHLEKAIQPNIDTLSSVDIKEIQIFTKEYEKKTDGNSLIGHTQWFDRLFMFTFVVGFMLLVLSLYKLKVIAWLCYHLT